MTDERAGQLNEPNLIVAMSEVMSQSYVEYPDGTVRAPFIDWFNSDSQDAMDFGVLSEPEFHGYSDIAIMQMEWYVQEILRGPLTKAIMLMIKRGLINELGIEILKRDGVIPPVSPDHSKP